MSGIFTWRYRTPDGLSDLLASSDGERLTGLHFATVDDIARSVNIGKDCGIQVVHETNLWLDIYFSGRQPDFTPPFRIVGATHFRKAVLEIVRAIPFGETVTYGEIAHEIAKREGVAKMSARAVGGAVGWNPICVIIPCHRVIGANGRLTGYGGGMSNKIALLAHEGQPHRLPPTP